MACLNHGDAAHKKICEMARQVSICHRTIPFQTGTIGTAYSLCCNSSIIPFTSRQSRSLPMASFRALRLSRTVEDSFGINCVWKTGLEVLHFVDPS